MTPEDRAEKVVIDYHAERCWGYDPNHHAEYITRIAAAIREAVDARLQEDLLKMPPGQLTTWPDRPPELSYAYEVTSDGQSVRYEAPTLDGLLELLRRTDPQASWNEKKAASMQAIRRMMADGTDDPQPTVVEGT